MDLKNKEIFITGGAGFLGKGLIERYYADNKITIFSRDEAKHYFIKKKYPKIKTIIGDISNKSELVKAGKGHSIGIFAASLKQIESVNCNYNVAKKTIIDGAFNSRVCAEENNYESACFISTDKSRAATTLYGAMKFVAGEAFIINAPESNGINLSTAIYGNVTNSVGSIIPLIWDSLKEGYPLTLFSNKMTRFMLDINDAIDTIEFALTVSGYNVIPQMHSYRVVDLFEIFSEEFGLKYSLGTPRVSEKIDEIVISTEEVPRVTKSEKGNFYLMHYEKTFNCINFKNNKYSSKDYLISKEDLFLHLKKNDFYRY